MDQWEYKIIRGSGWNHEDLREQVVTELNTQGTNGWELICVVGEFFYFKRNTDAYKRQINAKFGKFGTVDIECDQ